MYEWLSGCNAGMLTDTYGSYPEPHFTASNHHKNGINILFVVCVCDSLFDVCVCVCVMNKVASLSFDCRNDVFQSGTQQRQTAVNAQAATTAASAGSK